MKRKVRTPYQRAVEGLAIALYGEEPGSAYWLETASGVKRPWRQQARKLLKDLSLVAVDPAEGRRAILEAVDDQLGGRR